MANENSKDEKWREWIYSMQTMMMGLSVSDLPVKEISIFDLRVKESSIFDIPEQLRKSKEEAYTPKMVSIGPLHKGSKRGLLYMEEIKWHCMRSLLFRTRDPEKSLNECSKAIYAFDEVVRATYIDDIKFNSYDLSKIMLLDCCFLLELLISNAPDLDSDLKSQFSGPGAEVGKMKLVLSDLKLLENQVPIFILIVLFKKLFVENPSEAYEEVRKIVNGLVLCFFGYSSTWRKVDSPNCAHFLELIHWFMTKDNHVSITVERNFDSSNTEPKLERCVARLEDAGITIAPLDADLEERGTMFGCDNIFNKKMGKLKIQPLYVTETLEVEWLNFIAWEQNRIRHEKFLPKKPETQIRTHCKFSHYAFLFKGLICCEHDIQLLKDREVLIVGNGERSNEDLMTFFHEIADRIQIDANADSEFSQLINSLNTYLVAKEYHIIFFWHYCIFILTKTRYKCRSMYAELKRDHTPTVWKKMGVIAAIVLLSLTIAQTIFGAMSL